MPSSAYAREVAAETLALLVPDPPRLAVPVFSLARLLKVQIQPWPFTKIVGGLFRDELGPVIVFNPALPLTRVRLTIAHELGHYLLHSRARSYFQCAGDGKSRAEREASSFAFALLMPADRVNAAWRLYSRVEVLAAAFKVPEEMVAWRMKELRLRSP